MKSRFLKTGAQKALIVLLLAALCLPLFAAAEDQGTSILLTFTGDCTLGGQEGLRERPYSFVSHVKKHGYDYPFAKVKEFFEEDDLTIINLENVFFDKTTTPATKNYLFRSTTDFAQILPRGSVEVAFLANNHIMDYGKNGMNSTIAALEEQRVAWFGSNAQTNTTYIYEKDGIKVGFLGSFFGYWYNHRAIMDAALEGLKAAGCQAIVGVIHDGTEYEYKRSRPQQLMANWMVANGVSLVVGHHPHVVQGIDQHENATVIFSLGNFSFGGNKSLDIARRPGKRADKALIVRAELRFDQDKNYLGHQVNLIPVSPSGVDTHNNYQPVFLSGKEALDTMAMVQKDTAIPLPPFVEGLGVLMDFVPAQPKVPEETVPEAPADAVPEMQVQDP